MRVSALVLVMALLEASAAGSQTLSETLTMGDPNSQPNSGDHTYSPVGTAVDLAHPANASGTIDHVMFRWSQVGCMAAAKIKVFRRVGDSFSLVAERGPYDITAEVMDVGLLPAIPVLEGDLIGVARVADCGTPTVFLRVFPGNYIEVAGDATGFSYSDSAVHPGFLSVQATGTASEVIGGVIPSVASNPGRNGSRYHTQIQMLAVSDLTGRFVFHAKGKPGGTDDPSMPFLLAAGRMQSWSDILEAMHVSGQPGSIDVVIPWGQDVPSVVAQVYTEQSGGGTNGFRERIVQTFPNALYDGSTILGAGSPGYIFGPADATRYRSNIAVRSLDLGVWGSVRVIHADGGLSPEVRFRYGPNTWDQKTWEEFTGVPLEDGDYAFIQVLDGSAIFAGSIIDNITNDPADVLVRAGWPMGG